MKVVALREGFYENKLIKEGQSFELKEFKGSILDEETGKLKTKIWSPQEQFSSRWMKKVGGEDQVLAKVSGRSKKQQTKVDDLKVI